MEGEQVLEPLDFDVGVEVDATFDFVLDVLSKRGLIHRLVEPFAVRRGHNTNAPSGRRGLGD